MIEYKKDIKKVLPYDRQQYLKFLDEGYDSSRKWYGVAFQLPGGCEEREISPMEYLDA